VRIWFENETASSKHPRQSGCAPWFGSGPRHRQRRTTTLPEGVVDSPSAYSWSATLITGSSLRCADFNRLAESGPSKESPFPARRLQPRNSVGGSTRWSLKARQHP